MTRPTLPALLISFLFLPAFMAEFGISFFNELGDHNCRYLHPDQHAAVSREFLTCSLLIDAADEFYLTAGDESVTIPAGTESFVCPIPKNNSASWQVIGNTASSKHISAKSKQYEKRLSEIAAITKPANSAHQHVILSRYADTCYYLNAWILVTLPAERKGKWPKDINSTSRQKALVQNARRRYYIEGDTLMSKNTPSTNAKRVVTKFRGMTSKRRPCWTQKEALAYAIAHERQTHEGLARTVSKLRDVCRCRTPLPRLPKRKVGALCAQRSLLLQSESLKLSSQRDR